MGRLSLQSFPVNLYELLINLLPDLNFFGRILFLVSSEKSMTNHFVNSANDTLPNTFINKKEIPEERWTIWHVGSGIGLLGGLMLLFGGTFLIIFQYLSGEKQTGVWLFAVVLPLWIFGAHCFDKVEEIEKARRIEYCRQHGMTDDECAEQKLANEI